MDKFRIVENLKCFRVQILAPKQKTRKRFLGIMEDTYYDENDMEWINVDDWGWPIYNYATAMFIKFPAEFETVDSAKKFIDKLRGERLILEY